jgi:hypothetical protein
MAIRAPRLQHGQATIEIVALVPAVVAIALIGWWVAAVAHEWTVASSAARAAVRAQEVGAPPGDAARAVLGTSRLQRATVDDATRRDGAPRAVVLLRLPGIAPGIASQVLIRGRPATGAGPGGP